MSDPSDNPSGRVDRPSSHGWATARRRLAELLIVFVGVYAAFLLNRFDTDRRDAKRREQILAAMEREVSTNISEYRNDLTQADAEIAEFDGQLARGDMPHLGIIFNNSGYSASDDATLLQAGGLELLDVETIELLRRVNAMQRSLVAAMHNQLELSLVELSNHTTADFYDPATHQLKKNYQWYPLVMHSGIHDAKEILAAEEDLLAHIHALQHPGASKANPVPAPAGQPTPPRSPAPSSPAA